MEDCTRLRRGSAPIMPDTARRSRGQRVRPSSFPASGTRAPRHALLEQIQHKRRHVPGRRKRRDIHWAVREVLLETQDSVSGRRLSK